MIALISLACVILFLIGTPVLLVIGLWSVGVSVVIDMPLSNFGVTLFEGLNAFALLAMPLFILTGDLINAAGIARKLTAFAHACLGPGADDAVQVVYGFVHTNRRCFRRAA